MSASYQSPEILVPLNNRDLIIQFQPVRMAETASAANMEGNGIHLGKGSRTSSEMGESPARHQEHDLAPLSRNAFIWWQLTSVFLMELVSHAGFTAEQQESSMKFYYRYVVPNLGPPPTADGLPDRWRSFMTDDFTPLEFSWNWGNADGVPQRRIRFSVEPVGCDAGSARDPRNIAATRLLAHQLGSVVRGIDLRWFYQLLGKMTSDLPPNRSSRRRASPSSAFLGFELGGPEVLVKAYLLPPRQYQRSQKREGSALCSSLMAFAEENSWATLANLVGFLKAKGRAMQLWPFMVGVDCISEQPRVKVYVRSPDTSFASAARILTMFEDGGQGSNGLDELQDLWKRVFCLGDGFDHRSQLRPRNHETAGMLYYLEVRPNSRHVSSKVYLPVKHYGGDDWSTALGLVGFFKSRNRVQTQVADQYLSSLKAVCSHRRLEDGRGMHTYITATIRNGSLDITSYLNPEVYHGSRYGG